MRPRTFITGTLACGLAATLPLGLVAQGAAAAPSGVVAAAKPKPVPPKAAFFVPPSPLPSGGHGTLIRKQKYRGVLAVKGAKNVALLYKQDGFAGGEVATSGFVSVPQGKAPKHGWPVVAWAHGTTGNADSCAPTRDTNRRDAKLHGGLMKAWVKAGYAVVRTDYEGLGTPGEHPYLIGVSQGRSVLDSVLAARHAVKGLGTKVVIAGHSQGGHAALWAASLAPTYTPALKLKGTLALAPPSHLADQIGLLKTQTSADITGTVLMILRGLAVADPTLDVPALLTDQAFPDYQRLSTTCLGQLDSQVPLNQVVREGADTSAVIAGLKANDPGVLSIRGPVMIEQGGMDTTVRSLFTDLLVDELKAGGTKVAYEFYDFADHGTVVDSGFTDSVKFVRRRLG